MTGFISPPFVFSDFGCERGGFMSGKLRNMTSIYLRQNGRMLLLYRIGSRVVAPSWCGIGGHFEKDELNDAQTCVLREMQEEIGLTGDDLTDLRLRYVTLRLKKNEIRQNYYFFADVKPDVNVPMTCSEGQPKWFQPDELPLADMPHTARYVLKHYLALGQQSAALYAGAATADGVVFTALDEF